VLGSFSSGHEMKAVEAIKVVKERADASEMTVKRAKGQARIWSIKRADGWWWVWP
jgi:hypothetical protein